MRQPTTTPTLLRLEATGNWKAPPEDLSKTAKRRSRHGWCGWFREMPWPIRVVSGVLVLVFLMDLLLNSEAEFDGEPMAVMVLGSLGSGTFSLARSLRLHGLDVSHEATDGVDGVVSWAHALMYLGGRPPATVAWNGTALDPLCVEFFPWPTWHVQSVAPIERLVCGDAEWAPFLDAAERRAQENCWRKTCGDVLGDLRGCAVPEVGGGPGHHHLGAPRGCPLPVAERPVVLTRHPLRTIESLVAGFCPAAGEAPTDAAGARPFVAAPAKAAARLLGPDAPRPLDLEALEALPCARQLAEYWRSYYAALAPLVARGDAALVAREDGDATCEIVRHVRSPREPWKPNPRVAAAKKACKGKRLASAGQWVPYLRQELNDLLRDGWNNDYDNHLNGPKKKKGLRGLGGRRDAPPHVDISWADLRDWDAGLAADIAALARTFGYDDAP